MDGPGAGRDLVALVHEAYAFWNREGIDAFAERWWAPDIVWEEAPAFPEAGTRTGREACLRRMEERFVPLGHVDIDVRDARPLTNRAVLQELTVRGRGSASGIPTEMRLWMISELGAGDQVVWMREFLDPDEAERAAAALVTRPDR
jgi:ketosteroid isomerase-like protein